jgi:cytochrome P450
VERYIRERNVKAGDDYDDQTSFFIDRISKESANETEIRDQLLNVLLAGRDTTACALSWTM